MVSSTDGPEPGTPPESYDHGHLCRQGTRASFRDDFQEGDERQTKGTQAPHTPRSRPVGPRHLLAVQLAATHLDPPGKPAPPLALWKALPKCHLPLTSTSPQRRPSIPLHALSCLSTARTPTSRRRARFTVIPAKEPADLIHALAHLRSIRATAGPGQTQGLWQQTVPAPWSR